MYFFTLISLLLKIIYQRLYWAQKFSRTYLFRLIIQNKLITLKKNVAKLFDICREICRNGYLYTSQISNLNLISENISIHNSYPMLFTFTCPKLGWHFMRQIPLKYRLSLKCRLLFLKVNSECYYWRSLYLLLNYNNHVYYRYKITIQNN